MALFMRRFNKYLKKGFKDKDHKKTSSDSRKWTSSDKRCYECGKYGHFVSHFLKKGSSSKHSQSYKDMSHKKDEQGKKEITERPKSHKKKKAYKKGRANIGEAWCSDDSSLSSSSSSLSSESSDEENIAGFAQEGSREAPSLLVDDHSDIEDIVIDTPPTCFMAKGTKVSSHKSKHKHASSDDDSSDDSDLSESDIPTYDELAKYLEKHVILLAKEKKKNEAMSQKLNESYEVFEKLNKLHFELKTTHEEMGINHINLKRTHAELEDKVKELESSLLVKENSQSMPIQISPRIVEKEVIKTICNQCAN